MALPSYNGLNELEMLKLIAAQQLSPAIASSNLPYGADEQVITNAVGGPGPTMIVYKKSGATVKTRTLTYSGSGSTDVLIHTIDN